MQINVNNEVGGLLNHIAGISGRPVDYILKHALENYLEMQPMISAPKRNIDSAKRAEDLLDFGRRFSKERVDFRSADEIIGYDENGLPS